MMIGANKFWILAAVFVAALACSPRACAGPPQSGITGVTTDEPYVVEYYYKAKWGHAEEFLALFKKNHYPVL
jgi:hypothetical protein